MAEVLEAILQLDINSFTAALQQAAQQVTAFAQAIQGSVGSSAQVFQQQVQQINQVVTATKQAAQAKKDTAKDESEFEKHLDELRLQMWKHQQEFKARIAKEDAAIAKQAATDNMAQEKAVGEFIMKVLADRQAAAKATADAMLAMQKNFFTNVVGLGKEAAAAEATRLKNMEALQQAFLNTTLGMAKVRQAAELQLQRDFFAVTQGLARERIAEEARTATAMTALQKAFFANTLGMAKEAQEKEAVTVRARTNFYRQMEEEKQRIFRQTVDREVEEHNRRVAIERETAARIKSAREAAAAELNRIDAQEAAIRAKIMPLQADPRVQRNLGGNLQDPSMIFGVQNLQTYLGSVQEAVRHTTFWEAAIGRVGTSLKTLGGYFVASFLLGIPFAIAAWGKEAVEVAVKMEALRASFLGITGNANLAANTLTFLRTTANKLGLDFIETANQFKNLQAASQGTRLEGEKIRTVFEQVSMAQRVLGLSGEQASRGLLAIEQMVSKGTITMEELRKQLSQAIPGSVGIMARALGVGTDELTKMMKAGDLLAEDVLPRFGRQLQKELGQNLFAATESAAANFARFGNNLRDISLSVGDYILRMLKPIISTINQAFDLYNKAKAAGEDKRNVGLPSEPVIQDPELKTFAPDLYRQVDALYRKLVDAREVLKELRRPSGTARGEGLLEAAGIAGVGSMADEQKFESLVDDLDRQWKLILKKKDDFLESMKQGGDETGETPFAREIKAVREETDKAKEALTALAIQKKNIPSLFMGKGELEEAREGMRQLETEINKVTKAMATAKASQSGAVIPQFQAHLATLNAQYQEARAAVEKLEEADRLKKELATEDKKRRADLMAEEEQRQAQLKTMTEKFQRDIAEMTEGTSEKKLVAMQQELEKARELGMSETLIAQREASIRAKIQKEEYEESVKYSSAKLSDIKSRAAKQQELELLITTTEASATKTRLDNWYAAQDAKRQKLEEGYYAEIQLIDAVQLAQFEAATAAGASRIVQEENAKLLKEAEKTWRDFANTLENTLAGTFQSILSGSKSLWEGLRDGFLKLLVKLGADALTHKIIIPIILGFIGGGSAGGRGGVGGAMDAISGVGGAAGVPGGGGGGSDIIGTALGLASAGNSVSGALGGPSLNLGGMVGGAGTLGSVMGMELGELGVSGAGYIGGAQGSLMGLSSATVGSVVGGIGAGIAVGMVLKQLNNMLGIKGTAGTVLAGAGGGALAGTMILPGIGTAIGTVVGALGGLIASLVGKEPKPPGFDIQQIQPGQVNYNDIVGMQISQPFDILKDFHQRLGTDYEEFVGSVEDGINEMFASVIAQVSGASPDVQRALVGPLNEAFARVASAIASYPSIEGGDFKKRIEQMMQDFGTYFEAEGGAAVAELMSAVQRIDPIIKAFNQIIEGLLENIRQLEQQQRELNTSLENNLTTLRESLMSPGEILRARKVEFDTLMTQFEGGDEATKIALAPQIGQLANAILELSKNVFQQSFGDLTGIQAGQRTIGESLFSPQQSLNARYADLERLMGDFTTGTAAMQTILAPQITQLTAQIMDLTKAVIAEREALMVTFPAQIRSLTEALYTPTEQLTAAQVHLQELLREFRGGSPSRQMQLEPEIAQLANTILGLAQQVGELAEAEQALAEQQAKIAEHQALIATFPQQLRSISESLFSPAQRYLSSQDQLAVLMQQFRSGTPEQQAALEPQIAQIAAQIMELARDQNVLGQDAHLLRQTQSELLAVIQEVQGVLSAQTVDSTNQTDQLKAAIDQNRAAIERTQAEMLAVVREVQGAIYYQAGVSWSGDMTVAQLMDINRATLERTQLDMLNTLNRVEWTMAGNIVNMGWQTIAAIHHTAGVLNSTTYTMANGIITATYNTSNGVVTAQYNSMGQIIGTDHYLAGVMIAHIDNTSNTVAGWSNAIYQVQAALIGQVASVRDTAWQSYLGLINALWTEIGIAQYEIQLLLASLGNLQSVDAAIARALGVLGEMNWRLGNPLNVSTGESISTHLQRDAINIANASLHVQRQSGAAMIAVASKQAYGLEFGQGFEFGRQVIGFQHGGYIPRNMSAFLHAGERVVPEWENRGGGGKNITIQVYGGGRDASQIADLVIQKIESKSGRLQSTTIQTSRR